MVYKRHPTPSSSVCSGAAIMSVKLFVIFMLVGVVNGHIGQGRFGDEILYDRSAQSKCTEVTRPATRDCRWPSGLNRQMDQVAAGGKIIAYKIRWFNGSWSSWYVPGYNDMDGKFNLNVKTCSVPYVKNSLRRMWSYFYDHTHMFIICKDK